MSDPSDPQERSHTAGEDDDAPQFKVTDRRHFDREGNLREDVDLEDEDEPPAPEEELLVDSPGGTAAREPTAEDPNAPQASRGAGGIRPPAGAAGPPGAAGAGDAGQAAATTPPVEEEPDAAEEAAGTAAGPRGRGEVPSPDELPRNFSALVQSMYFEALLYLGAVRHPQTGEVIEDAELAKYKIDLLGMLQDKTEGNLTAEESSELEEVLYQLRMLYLQKTNVAKL